MTATAPAAACHAMLLRLAGHVPDDLLTCCRRWLADGRVEDLAHALADGVLCAGAPMRVEDVALLGQLLAGAGTDPGVLAGIRKPSDRDTPSFWFQRKAPEYLDDAGVEAAEKLAAIVMDTASRLPQLNGLWQAWRVPFDDESWPPPGPVFVAEAKVGADLAVLTGWLQADLLAAGAVAPQVEVYEIGGELPDYQRLARALGALLWAERPGPGPRLARLFDEFDTPGGPRFAADHPRLDDRGEVDRILHYLNAADVVLTAGRGLDAVPAAPTGSDVLTFRTDGAFVWPDAAAYYLDKFALSPDPDLLARIRAAGYVPPVVDGVAMHRATALLLQSGNRVSPAVAGTGRQVVR